MPHQILVLQIQQKSEKGKKKKKKKGRQLFLLLQEILKNHDNLE